MAIEFDRQLLLTTFAAEAEEILGSVEEQLLSLENDPRNRETIGAIFRAVHTLKGSAACIGMESLASVLHRVEDFLDRLREGKSEADGDTVTNLLAFVDSVRGSVAAAAAGEDRVHPAAQTIADALNGTATDATAPAVASGISPAAPAARNIRIETGRLDRILDLTGEISIARGRVRQQLDQRRSVEAVNESYGEVERLSAELQELVMKLRMVPIGPFFRQYMRVVRDTAAAHGKLARLVLDGEDVEVDLGVVEHLRNPLTHMIRNAIDHGIETPQRRTGLGKPEEGRITLSAHRDASTIVIRIADDGAGLDRVRIAERARANGIDTTRLAEAELVRLIFMPGFTTADKVTDLSGRGIGMDVVRRNIEELHGTVSVESRNGTAFTIRLPLTLAIIDGFVVEAGRESYILPLDCMIECLQLPGEAANEEEYGVLNVRGVPVPFVRLRKHFRMDDPRSARGENMVIVTASGGRAGLVVDRLEGEQQVVIKPLGRLFQGIPGLAGSAVLGSGRVAIVLDVGALIDQCIESSAAQV